MNATQAANRTCGYHVSVKPARHEHRFMEIDDDWPTGE
jgi:hypothetical protein